ncbi:MurR/RpiR family transcriptional regulator [Palleronia sp. LCG004]|uniref:MurR/RpiR family transcriptional regulator n=1 Tax=Palleronia sp. LCG004 TaxID=3079304 RepID=UPI002943BB46|nr:MurR/RpiR family transcriptional regulator [Palleronia sp. LCG004]WOI57891.1 MurR/RpiR family transcriptional regulator [Palleronia sp. LCG004]
MNDLPASSLERRIRSSYATLPLNEQRLADTILSFPGELASYSAAELARLAEVSPATASRFFKRIGYENYAAARRDARAAQRWGSPFYMQTREATGRSIGESLRQHVEVEKANIDHTFQRLSESDLLAALEMLKEAERVFCLGFRTSAMVASYAAWLLGQLRDRVTVIGRADNTLSEQIVGIGKGDVVLAVGLRRRLPIFSRLLGEMRKNGARVILIADPTAQKSAANAHLVLSADGRSSSLFDSDAAANSIVHLLCGLLSAHLGQAAQDRQRAIESLHSDLGEF